MSVLIAAYKHAHFEEALRSACAQTFRDLEIVVVDDSGGDEIRRIVERVNDPRIQLTRNATNLGTSGSYQAALSTATRPLLAVLNDDDLWEPAFVERLAGALEHEPRAVLAFADHYVLRDGRRDLSETEQLARTWGRETLHRGLHQPFRHLVLQRTVPIAIAAVFRRSAITDLAIPPSVGGAYDLYLAYILARGSAGAVYIDERLSSWRVHDNNLTSVPSIRRAEEGAEVFRLMLHDESYRDVRDMARAGLVQTLWPLATRNLRAGRRCDAFATIGVALRHGHIRSLLLVPLLLIPTRLLSRGIERPVSD